MVIVLAVHVIIAVFLIGIILLQKNEGGLGGLGGGAGGLGGMMSGRAKSNALTKATSGLAATFFVTSLVLAILSTHSNQSGPLVPEAPGTGSAIPAPASTPEPAPEEPATPVVPAGQ
jgi:preprotein translocase subunit SecG